MKKILATVITLGFAAAMANAALINMSISTTAPATDGLDVWNYSAQTGTQKWFNDVEHDAGQTFTPAADGILNSFTIQLAQGNAMDAAEESVLLRLGTITRPGGVFTFTDIYSSTSSATSSDPDWLTGDYLTFDFETPQAVTGGVEYGVITDAQAMGAWQNGIPYRVLTGNTYAGGSLINRGGEITNNAVLFHADLSAIPEPSTLSLLAVGVIGGLILRARRT